jgi:4-amino-4-deoxy-L-arabinose transferase-like glycosyltransferase
MSSPSQPPLPAQKKLPSPAVPWLILGLLLGFSLLTTQWLSQPFHGHHGWDNLRLAMSVQNYLRYGYVDYQGLQVINLYPLESPEQASIYRSSPPTLAIISSLSARAFSFSEFSVRLPNVWISLISICLFYQLGRQLYGSRSAMLSSYFFVCSPFVLYFSQVVNWEAGNGIISSLLLITFWAYKQQPSRQRALALYLLAFAGLWFSDFIAYLLSCLFLYSLWFGDRRLQIFSFSLGLMGLVGLFTWLAYTTGFFSANGIDELWGKVALRGSNTVEEGQNITLLGYLQLLALRLCYGLSPFILLLGAYGVFLHWGRPRPPKFAPADGLVLVLLGASLFYTTLWRNATYIHDYFLYSMAAPLCLWAGQAIDHIWGQGRGWLPSNRAQRFADAFLLGQALFALAVFNFFINYKHQNLMDLAALLKAQTSTEDRIAFNLDFDIYGPLVDYYSYREISYLEYELGQEQALPAQLQGYDYFILCTPDLSQENPLWQARARLLTEFCYLIPLEGLEG